MYEYKIKFTIIGIRQIKIELILFNLLIWMYEG